jgi:RimJ/RimL family protein N-acetyltransferase
MLYSDRELSSLDSAVRLTTPDVAAVRRAQTDPGEWGRWLETAIADDSVVYFSITADSELVGEVFLHDIDDDRSEAMFGYHIFDSERRNQGIGRAALRMLFEWTAGETAIRHVFAITREDNTPSRRLIEGAGFSYVGRAREDDHRVVYDWRASDLY